MRFPPLSAAGFALALALAAPVEAPATPTDSKGTAQSYKWVDADGTIHYGDRVPVEATGRERAVLNRQGIPVRELEAQKTIAEQEEDARREAESLRQRQHDQFLLTTYATAKDIEQLRDLRLGQIDGMLRAGWLYVDTLEGRLRDLQTRAFAFRPYSERPGAKRLPDDLAEDLVHTLNEAESQRRSLEAKRMEQEAMREQFEADIARFREIKLARAP
jgi:hypothetical protein